MGRTLTPTYVVEMTGFVGFGQTPMAWKGRVPTVAQLEKFVMEQTVSTMPGFVNEHLGKAYGIQLPSRCVVRRNNGSRQVMVEWKAPAFMMLPNPANYPNVAKAFRRG